MAETITNPSLEELAPKMRDGTAIPQERQDFFYAIYCMELEVGQPVDVEAIGVTVEEVKAWLKRYPFAATLAKQQCDDEIREAPEYPLVYAPPS